MARWRGRLVGYLCLWEIGHEIHVTNLATHPDVRRHGVARALLGAVLDDARGRAVTLAFLEVRPTNTEALGLYERFGFLREGYRKGHYSRAGEDVDAILMALYIS